MGRFLSIYVPHVRYVYIDDMSCTGFARALSGKKESKSKKLTPKKNENSKPSTSNDGALSGDLQVPRETRYQENVVH